VSLGDEGKAVKVEEKNKTTKQVGDVLNVQCLTRTFLFETKLVDDYWFVRCVY